MNIYIQTEYGPRLIECRKFKHDVDGHVSTFAVHRGDKPGITAVTHVHSGRNFLNLTSAQLAAAAGGDILQTAKLALKQKIQSLGASYVKARLLAEEAKPKYGKESQ